MDANIEFIRNQNNQIIPLLNSIPLHDREHPLKEAESFVTQNIDKIKNNNVFLVLGLGHGYHINQLIKYVKLCTNSYQIYVLEPSQELVKAYRDSNDCADPRVKIISRNNITELFQSRRFIDILTRKPAILTHAKSVAANNLYYKSFLGYQAPKTIADYMDSLPIAVQANLRNYENNTLEEYLRAQKLNRQGGNTTDYFFSAINEIAQIN